MWDNIKDTIVQYSGKIVGAIIIFIVGWYICKFLGKVIERALAKSRLEDTAAGFISNVCKYTLRIILLIIVITHLGVNMTSIVALITSAALAVGMALQGSLSNIAGGLLLLVNKPFTVNDYISDGGHWMRIKGITEDKHFIVTSWGDEWELLNYSPYLEGKTLFFFQPKNDNDGGLIFIDTDL